MLKTGTTVSSAWLMMPKGPCLDADALFVVMMRVDHQNATQKLFRQEILKGTYDIMKVFYIRAIRFF
jgi:hypothetical protein